MTIALARREFIAALGGAAAWPFVSRAQSTMPVIGFLASASADGYARVVAEVREGLKDTGYVEGRNLAIEYRWANYQYDRLPELAADLVRRQVAVLYSTGSMVSAVAAKTSTATIPIVFANGSDPVRNGLVASLSRPGGNVTGVTFFNSELAPKRIELLREIVPKAAVIAVLMNPNNPNAAPDSKSIHDAGRSLGVQIEVVNASNEHELDDAFANLSQLHADALMVHIDALFQARDKQIIALAARYAMPTMYTSGQFASLGGLIGYGTNVPDMYRLSGTYVGRILKGAKPADLPIQQPTKFHLVVNLRTAKTLGLDVPLSMLMRVDEVIE